MIYKVSKIVEDVRISINENVSGEQLLDEGDMDTLSLDDIVRSKIVEAVQRVESSAPAHYLEEGHDFGDAVYWDKKRLCGRVLLPDDFMRLIAFRMSDWERTCYSAISAADPEYDLQSSRYGGIRGNVQKPVCAIVNRADGKSLEFWSCKSTNAYVKRASYIPYPEIDNEGGIDISERCYTAVLYTVASLVLMTYGAAEQSSQMGELAKSILE